jgi:hypothetical protein
MISLAVSQNETVTITFDELIEFATRHSPSVQIIEETYGLINTDQKIDIQWANPDISYSHEFVDGTLKLLWTL